MEVDVNWFGQERRNQAAKAVIDRIINVDLVTD